MYLERVRRQLPGIVVALVATALAILAASADSRVVGAIGSLTALDAAVGLAFIAAGWWTPGQVLQRLLIGAVGITWLMESIFPRVGDAHQAVLLVALVCFPTGRPRSSSGWIMVALAVPVGLAAVPQVGVAVLFAIVALEGAMTDRRRTGWFRVLMAASVDATITITEVGRRLTPQPLDPRLSGAIGEFVLILIAIALPVAKRSVLARGERFADRVVRDDRLVGLDGLAIVLREALHDPELQILRWGVAEEPASDGIGAPRPRILVEDASGPLATVVHNGDLAADPALGEGVIATVQLAVRNLDLREEIDRQLVDLEAARGRLLAAADRERVATAARLRVHVISPLQQAAAALTLCRDTLAASDDAVEALSVAIDELQNATDDVAALVAGTPLAALGNGKLREAVNELARRSPVEVTVTEAGDSTASTEIETTLFYVCSEAMTNAIKHARARHILVAIDARPDSIAVSVSDDGSGGVDARGSGLMGLTDRLESRHGRLRVESPPGAGTTVTAIVPR